MRLRFKRRRFGLLAIASSLGPALESLVRKTQAQPKPQSNLQSAKSPAANSVVDVKLQINGVEHALKIEPPVTLLDLLRERLSHAT
ncbi:hypothetical protein [Dendronalium phyllosphericum]|uniref:hypothetical protein n=1 Tax=Dendronalium phyllosphericum TaxID=2840445 RepID=UPI00298EE3B4|nr:hypothetical protein [Dendronalium phyllosphericum]